MRVGRLFGIPLDLHWSLVLLVPFVMVLSARSLDPGQAALQLTTVFALVYVSVLLHELGHALVARRLGVEVHSITLLPFMGATRMDHVDDPGREVLITLAGPFVNLLVAAIALPIGLLTFRTFPDGVYRLGQHGLSMQIVEINLMLGLFNLLPAFPLDGGGVLRAALTKRMGRLPATELAVRIGNLFAFALLLYGVIVANLVWVGAALWLWVVGQQERGRTIMIEQLRARGATGIPPELVLLMDMMGIPPDRMREAMRTGNPFAAAGPGAVREGPPPAAPRSRPTTSSYPGPQMPPPATPPPTTGRSGGRPPVVDIDLSSLFGSAMPAAGTPTTPTRRVDVEVLRIETNPPPGKTEKADNADAAGDRESADGHHHTRDGRHFYKGQELL
ncbi:MAG: M50 family metallopeptidase [Planctomycetota bacterium]